MSRILIIEDEEAIADLEKDYLELSGFEVEICNRGDTGLTYDTPREKIEHLTADLTAMLQAQPDVQPDGVTIALDKFNDYSIDLACRVYITKVNLRDFMQVKNTLNLQIFDLMKEEGCEFAFPTTTVDLPERK